ncbi:response regulator transcription factor [Sciscionella marina]|uniref:response regulator transcription factor n=1 Tax=Sciscionella marina TaxID=508770 RepID=UPI001F09C7DD|nr:response regulator transcription factor [Sciscionella marina]
MDDSVWISHCHARWGGGHYVRILVVEDEQRLADAIRKRMTSDGHLVDVVRDGSAAVHAASERAYDAAFLDVMLPGMNGFEVCNTLRDNGKWLPIIMITARDSVRDRTRGLDCGADDYVIKPFAFTELMARLRAVLRRKPQERPTSIVARGVELVPDVYRVRYQGADIELSTREFRLLEYLMLHNGQTLSRAKLLHHVWGSAAQGKSNVVDVYVGYIRRKLTAAGCPDLIRTVRGIGYGIET